MGTSTARAQLLIQAKDEGAASVMSGIAGKAKELGTAGETASGGLGKMGGALSNVAQIAAGVGLGISLQGLAQGAIAFGQASIKMAMDMEQTRVGFTTMIGSAQGAEEHLRSLREFAAGTPFQFTELIEASKRLQAFGFEAENVVPMLRDIGDAVGAMGGGADKINRVTMALGQMQAKGKVSAEEMMQLTEAGIPGWKYLAQAVGVSAAEVQKMTSKGLIPAGDAIQYILDGMRQDFGGMMAAQSATAAGQMSNLTDKIEAIQAAIGEKLLPAVKDLIAALSTAGDAALTLITWNERMGETMAEHGQQVSSTAQSYDEYITEVKRAAQAAGYLIDENGNLVTVMYGEVVQANYAVTESTWRANKATEEYGLGLRNYVQDALDARQATLDAAAAAAEEIVVVDAATEAKYRAKQASDLLAAATRGPMTEAQVKYQQTTAEVNAEIEKTKLQLDEYVAKEAAAVVAKGHGSEAAAEYRDKIAEAHDKLGELTGKLDSASASLAKTTAEFIFQQAAAGLDAGAALDLARSMGLVDEASYATAKGVQDLRDKYDTNRDGAIDAAEAARGYTTDVGTLNSTIQGMQNKDVTITVTTVQREIIYQSMMDQARENAGKIGGRQHGGPVIPGRDYIMNESLYTRPETLILGQMGTVMTRQQMGAMMANAGGGPANDAIAMTLRALPAQIGRAVRDAVQLAG